MGRNTNPNQQPFVKKKEETKPEREERKRRLEIENQKEARRMTKFLRHDPPISTSLSTSDIIGLFPSNQSEKCIPGEKTTDDTKDKDEIPPSFISSQKSIQGSSDKIPDTSKFPEHICKPANHTVEDQDISSTFDPPNTPDGGEKGIESILFDFSDPSTWSNPLLSCQKTVLLSAHPVQKLLKKYPKNGSAGFNAKNYSKIGKSSDIVTARDWLLYSESTNSLFCFCCCLFTSSNKTTTQSPWTTFGNGVVGFSDFVHQARGIVQHEESQNHFQSVILWKQYLRAKDNSKLIDQVAAELSNVEIGFWKDVLRGLLDAIIYLAKNSLAFRGSSSNIKDHNCGNFLSLVQLLSKYHPPLAVHLDRLKKGSTSYMSPQIQNEFIDMTGRRVKQAILEEIKHRKFYSIMFDATPDSAHQEQIGEVIRTVRVTDKGCNIEENFLGFINFDGKTGELMTHMIVENLHKDGLDLKNCRGQGYDNGANMSGIYSGVQARIRELNELAVYIPCAAHSLNLVGQNAANRVLPAKLILGQIQNLFTFFAHSTLRWTILKKHVKKTLKGQSTTRWSSKADAVSTLADEFENVCAALVELTNSSDANQQTAADADSHNTQICNFKFLLGLLIWEAILRRIQVVNLAFQQKDISAEHGAKHARGLLTWLNEFHEDGFEDRLQAAQQIAERLGIEEDSGFMYRRTRGRCPARFRDDDGESAVNLELSNIDRFKLDFFIPILDNLTEQFGSRFDNIYNVTKDFEVLWGTSLDRADKQEQIKSVQDLVVKYKDDFHGPGFVREIVFLKGAVSEFVHPKKLCDTTPLEILNIITCNNLQGSFINCHTALRIFLTLPVSVATNERAFSKAKIIKNYLRSSTGQQRFVHLSILSIEHSYTNEISFDSVIEGFALSKCRRVKI